MLIDLAEATGGNPREWPTQLVAYPNWETDFKSPSDSAGLQLKLDDAIEQVNEWPAQIEQASTSAQVDKISGEDATLFEQLVE